MAIQTRQLMAVEEYFEWEQRQEHKHEYIDGVVIEMPGVSSKHSQITVNIILALGNAVDRSRITLHTENMRVQVNPTRYVYPDLSIVRGESDFLDASEYNLLNPCFVLEVTSPTSIARDREEKPGYYYDVPSIEACLIVDQHRVCAELYRRGPEGWRRQTFTELDDVISLAMLNCELPLDQVYLGIDFEET